MAWWGWLLAGLGLAALMVVAAVFLLWGRLRRLRDDPLARRVAALPLRAKIRLLWRLGRDSRVPWWTKALLPALALYLAMPFDLIPDFIPVLGYLDDLVILLLVASLLLRGIPRDVIEENVRALAGDGKGATTGEGRGR